ncbi:MAG: DEAD/DEAH box helicase [Pseudomonadota bacterium]
MSKNPDSVADYVAALLASSTYGRQVVHHHVMPSKDAEHAVSRRPWSKATVDLMAKQGLHLAADAESGLYAHQALATDHVRAGHDIIVATPTASGKTYVYNLPIIEHWLHDPEAKALYLFPLKALAQDQLATFERLVDAWPKPVKGANTRLDTKGVKTRLDTNGANTRLDTNGANTRLDTKGANTRPVAAIYDGDTTPHFRRKIRNAPPTVLITNPEMLHLALLPHHEQWTELFASLSYIVVDEVHTYRGVLGAHMAQVFRRLLRICQRYGAKPTMIFCSATVGNPRELASNLTGKTASSELPVLIDQSGAPQGTRHFLIINPDDSPSTMAIQLLRSALARGLRTIVYCQSRRMTELISMWVSQNAGPYKDRISAYRAGFLPEERRHIESRMASGELLAVISTSALELGIDIGSLDLCILVGYPGTVMATLQRGGRVGRAQQESAVVLIAGEDALDQYFVRHPEALFTAAPENAVLNPDNAVIMERHIECAAAEMPLQASELGTPWLSGHGAKIALAKLEREGLILRSADGKTLFASRKRPQRHVNLRGTGHSFTIESEVHGDKAERSAVGTVERSAVGTVERSVIGTIDGHRAQREVHEGAVYVHRGKTWVVTHFDMGAQKVVVTPQRVSWFTRVRAHKTTEILSVEFVRAVHGTLMYFGRLRVTETVTGYEKRSNSGNRLLGIEPLDMPPSVFETEGLWFEIPEAAQHATEDALLHFMGSIHALEHAAIGILPLLVMTDRNDLGGISTPMHAQVGKPAVFIYDGMAGGAGLTREAFSKAEELFQRTYEAIAECPCETGCPACVHSPKCGSGNRPIDKAGALFLLQRMKECVAPDIDCAALIPSEAALPTTTTGVAPSAIDVATPVLGIAPSAPSAPSASLKPVPEVSLPSSYMVLDVETRRSAADVGGWNKADKMGVSIAVLYDSASDTFTPYEQDELPALFARLRTASLVIGFNISRFDYAVLQPFAAYDLHTLPTLDLLLKIKDRLSYRVSLDNLGKATFDKPKSADGLQALQWWKEGRLDLITSYCQDDVALTRDVYLHGREHGYLLFTNKAGNKVRVPVDW